MEYVWLIILILSGIVARSSTSQICDVNKAASKCRSHCLLPYESIEQGICRGKTPICCRFMCDGPETLCLPSGSYCTKFGFDQIYPTTTCKHGGVCCAVRRSPASEPYGTAPLQTTPSPTYSTTQPPDTQPPDTTPPDTPAPTTQPPDTTPPDTQATDTPPPDTPPPTTPAPVTPAPDTPAVATEAPAVTQAAAVTKVLFSDLNKSNSTDAVEKPKDITKYPASRKEEEAPVTQPPGTPPPDTQPTGTPPSHTPPPDAPAPATDAPAVTQAPAATRARFGDINKSNSASAVEDLKDITKYPASRKEEKKFAAKKPKGNKESVTAPPNENETPEVENTASPKPANKKKNRKLKLKVKLHSHYLKSWKVGNTHHQKKHVLKTAHKKRKIYTIE